MTDRGVIYSAAMVRSLIEGRKTQTRRLDSSPLASCQPGDRLWVRETWRTLQKWDDLKPRHLADDIDKIDYAADGYPRNHLWAWGKNRPPIFLPRWASRLTLIVTEVRHHHLQNISDADAIAEGVVHDRDKGFWVPGVDHPNRDFPYLSRPTAREMYAALWDTLHGSGEWLGNPGVVALTFRVDRRNIDR